MQIHNTSSIKAMRVAALLASALPACENSYAQICPPAIKTSNSFAEINLSVISKELRQSFKSNVGLTSDSGVSQPLAITDSHMKEFCQDAASVAKNVCRRIYRLIGWKGIAWLIGGALLYAGWKWFGSFCEAEDRPPLRMMSKEEIENLKRLDAQRKKRTGGETLLEKLDNPRKYPDYNKWPGPY